MNQTINEDVQAFVESHDVEWEYFEYLIAKYFAYATKIHIAIGADPSMHDIIEITVYDKYYDERLWAIEPDFLYELEVKTGPSELYKYIAILTGIMEKEAVKCSSGNISWHDGPVI